MSLRHRANQRTRIVASRCGMLFALLWTQVATAAALEPWADKRLPVADGLVAWYDASVERAARRSLEKSDVGNGERVALWHDASGAGRHLAQASPEAQPVNRQDGRLYFIRFDGQGSHLAADGLDLAFDDLTLFVVAAPFTDDGNFRAFLSANAKDSNDYTSGLNIDQGVEASRAFAAINVEGAGFGGARNLKPAASPFGQLQRMCLTSTVGTDGTALFLNGEAAGRRDRAASAIHMDRLTLGARYYTNGGPPETRGFFTGEIAEVLIYDRVLSDEERAAVDGYLAVKYGDLRTLPLPSHLAAVRPVPKVEEPPPVQMLAPGFKVRELPIELPNVNNVRYRADGKLVALGYNGHIHLLSDTTGDGLEDHVEVFWGQPGLLNPIGIALTPPGYAHGQGVFAASKGKVVLVVDTDGDDRGDELIVVAEGWVPIKQTVDAVGVAIGPDGSIYFGLGTQDYTNGYLLDERKQARYAIDQGRGAIIKVSPDFKHREQICSGVRFSVALAFNRHGDLFCTDQEGATWLPNGNPLDELLHIQPGRHYGFPPRHPRHLPHVIDEPSVYDYGPQHQSTCGFCFNEPAEGGQAFGPDWWQGNALVTGYSRGKLYRTTLVKTPQGYVADNALLACLNMLTVDACVSPTGELVVATHTGGPDWGTGPARPGKLFKISYEDRERPQPVRAWAAAPHEVHVTFDRSLEPAEFQNLRENVMIEYGAHVRAGDRFEKHKPGYVVVEMQARAPRRLMPVLNAALTADRRTLVLSTGPHTDAVSYAVLLPDARRAALVEPSAPGGLPQLPAIELTYDLSGVEARWQNGDGANEWTAWLPHLDVAAARGLLAGSASGKQLGEHTAKKGRLTLCTQLDLDHMLWPVVQPGSKVDFEFPPEHVTIVLESSGPIEVKTSAAVHRSQLTSGGLHRVDWTVSPAGDEWQPIEVTVVTGEGPAVLSASWHTDEDARPRAFQQRRFLLPWAGRARSADASEALAPPAELAGGDWHRGREVFFSEKGQCGKCHTVHGRGGWIGPDLSNLVHRDYTSVLRDIAQPSFAINPDHLAYNVVLDDGRVLTGMVQSEEEVLRIGDIKGDITEVARSTIEEMKPALVSIMPEGLPQAIGEDGMRDLLTFLLLPEPGGLEPAPIERGGAPPPRSRSEVGALLGNAAPIDAARLKPLELLLVAGPKDHGPSEHDYPAWQKRWTQLLSRAANVKVTNGDEWPTAEQWQSADVVAMYSANPAWTPERAADLDAFFNRGGGLVLLHYAVNGRRAPEELAARIGLASKPGVSRYRHGELDLNFQMPKPHPITVGFSTLRFVDESYWDLIGDEDRIQVLATQVEEGKPRPMVWTYERGRGRVFCSILGHYSWTFDDPLFRVLALRGIAWAAGEPVERFNDLVLPGARVTAAPVGAVDP